MTSVEPRATLLATALAAAGLAVWIAWPRASGREPEDAPPSPPELFSPADPCPAGRKTRVQAERFELEGRLLATRAGYDPHDGVLAVARLRLAESCFRISGLPARAARVASTARGLQARIEGDFAASRSALDRTIDGRQWDLARDHVQRLLRVTAHLGEHPYVSWLETIAGKVEVHGDRRN